MVPLLKQKLEDVWLINPAILPLLTLSQRLKENMAPIEESGSE